MPYPFILQREAQNEPDKHTDSRGFSGHSRIWRLSCAQGKSLVTGGCFRRYMVHPDKGVTAIVRAFVWLRQAIPAHQELAAKVEELGKRRVDPALHVPDGVSAPEIPEIPQPPWA